MALSACSRRLSGSVRARACSVTLSTASQPLAFRSSNTLSGLDALCRETPALCTSGKDTALDAVGLGLLAGPAPAHSHKHLGLSALGRPRPARRSPDGASHSLSVKQPAPARVQSACRLCSSSPRLWLRYLISRASKQKLMAPSRKRRRGHVAPPAVCGPPVASARAMLEH